MNNKETWKYAVLLGLVAILLNIPILDNEFVNWDDHAIYSLNENLREDWKSIEDIKWIFDLEASMRFAPVSWLAYKAIYEISGLNPIGVRIASLSLHTLNTILLFYLALIIFKISKTQKPEIWAFCLTLVWLVNPLRVEPVAWATGLTYLISTFFCLSSIVLILGNTSNEIKKDIIASLALTLSVASYPISYTVPLTIPIWIYLRNMGMAGCYKWKNIVPFILPMSLGLMLASWTTIKRIFSTSHWHTPTDISQISILSKIETVTARVVNFITSCIIPPEEITPAHFPGEQLWTWTGAIGLLMLLVLLMVSIKKGCISKNAVTMLLIAGITAGPVLGITEDSLLPVDRYSYLLSCLLLLALGLQLSELKVQNRVLGYVSVIYIGMLTILSLISHEKWNNTLNLVSHIYNTRIVKQSESWKARVTSNLAFDYARKGNYQEAFRLIKGIESPRLADSPDIVRELLGTLAKIAVIDAKNGNQQALEFIDILIKEGIIKFTSTPKEI